MSVGKEEEPPGERCRVCAKSVAAISISTQTTVNWVKDQIVMLEDSMESMKDSIELLNTNVEETFNDNDRSFIEDILDETIKEASSKSRSPSAMLQDKEDVEPVDNLVLALSDSEGSIPSSMAQMEEETNPMKGTIEKKESNSRRASQRGLKENVPQEKKATHKEKVTSQFPTDYKTNADKETNNAFYTNPGSLCVRTLNGKTQELMVGMERRPALKKKWQEHVKQNKDNEVGKKQQNGLAWLEGDATLPEGWQFSEPYPVMGRWERSFRSPCGAVLESREEVVNWLQERGVRLSVPSGLPVQEGDEASCTGFCNGGCPILALDISYFSKGDYNSIRRKTKIEHNEPEDKIKNKLVSSPVKALAGPGLCYGGAVFKAERTRLIYVEETIKEGGKASTPKLSLEKKKDAEEKEQILALKDKRELKKKEVKKRTYEDVDRNVKENKEAKRKEEQNKEAQKNINESKEKALAKEETSRSQRRQIPEKIVSKDKPEINKLMSIETSTRSSRSSKIHEDAVDEVREDKSSGKCKMSSTMENINNVSEIIDTNKSHQEASKETKTISNKSFENEKEEKKIVKETKNGGKGKKSRPSTNVEERIDYPESEQNEFKIKLNLKVDVTPTKEDKKQLAEAMKTKSKVSTEQQTQDILKVSKVSNLKRGSQTMQNILPDKETHFEEETNDETTNTDIHEPETMTYSVTASSESESVSSVVDTDTTDTEQKTLSPALLKGASIQPNGSLVLSDTDVSSENDSQDVKTKKLQTNITKQEKPTHLSISATSTPKAIEEGSMPIRSKRKLESCLSSESAESTKKIRLSSRRSNSDTPTTKTPKNANVTKTPITTGRNKVVSTPKTQAVNEAAKLNIEKLKLLQQQEISLIKREGTYVQCSRPNCGLWRLVSEYEDPATVPESWQCSMNADPEARVCGLGGEQVEDEETVDVQYTCGSMVWAKLKGCPMWPGMVDYCPDTQEFYWVEEEISETVPAWYNVVFFEGEGVSATRAWVKTENLTKMVKPVEQPQGWAKIKGSKKQKMKGTLRMAETAMGMRRENRLEKYSFASLFKGKWGKFADLTIDEEPEVVEESSPKKKKKIELVKTPKSAPKAMPKKAMPKDTKPQKINNRKSVGPSQKLDDTPRSSTKKGLDGDLGTRSKKTGKIDMDSSMSPIPDGKNHEQINKRKSLGQSQNLTETPKSSTRKSLDENLMGKSRKFAIMNLDSPRALPRKSLPALPESQTDLKTSSSLKKEEATKKVEHLNVKKYESNGDKVVSCKYEKIKTYGNNIETPPKKIALTKESSNTTVEQSSTPTAEKKVVTDIPTPLVPQTILSPLIPPKSPPKNPLLMPDKRTLVRLPSMTKNSKKSYTKPPLPSDVLIALAVRNLDPENHFGAKFSSIQAFLSLHFPYYNDQKLECREMIRRAYDINAKEETGKENFRIKGSLVEQLSVRIKSYVDRSRVLVRESMLVPEFLEVLLDKFEHGSARGAEGKVPPPWSSKMLAYLALLSLRPPTSSEQVIIFLSLVFPALGLDDRNDTRRQDFERVMRTDENIVDGHRQAILDTVHKFFSSNANRKALRESIYKLEFVNLVLPEVD